MSSKDAQLAASVLVQDRILIIRGHRMMLDADLAELYGTTTKRLNEQVKRNANRFPLDCMFRLTPQEKGEVVANRDHLQKLKFSPGLPCAFTEHGAVTAAGVLNTDRAVEVSVFVVRAFIRMRDTLSAHKELALKLSEFEQRLGDHDGAIQSLIAALQQLMEQPKPRKKKIGFGGGD